MPGLPIQDAELADGAGYPNRFTFLERGAWMRVNTFFGGVIKGELYLAILHLRVLAQLDADNNSRSVRERIESSRLINPLFFDPESFDSKSTVHRLAAAISWAMATFNGQDPDTVPPEHKAVAMCLAQPMRGGQLVYP